ncbi:hypothetical protein K1719_033650 [Acacia pycnantha]|nr:hypothetical protein K1719_033650 [Acacia pycnantha]
MANYTDVIRHVETKGISINLHGQILFWAKRLGKQFLGIDSDLWVKHWDQPRPEFQNLDMTVLMWTPPLCHLPP